MENEYPKRIAVAEKIHDEIKKQSLKTGMKIQAIVNDILKEKLNIESEKEE